MTVRISARARDDLAWIYALVSERQDESAADRILNRIREAFDLLQANPAAGPHPHWPTRHKELRFWVVSRTHFLIFYFHDDSGVSIERVLDGRRDVRRIINARRENPS